MSQWTDLIEALAARASKVEMAPPMVKHEDLWDQQKRIEALEAEVRYLSSVLSTVLKRLKAEES
jgi:hypothetical protein